jgi:hypothetical protein
LSYSLKYHLTVVRNANAPKCTLTAFPHNSPGSTSVVRQDWPLLAKSLRPGNFETSDICRPYSRLVVLRKDLRESFSRSYKDDFGYVFRCNRVESNFTAFKRTPTNPNTISRLILQRSLFRTRGIVRKMSEQTTLHSKPFSRLSASTALTVR